MFQNHTQSRRVDSKIGTSQKQTPTDGEKALWTEGDFGGGNGVALDKRISERKKKSLRIPGDRKAITRPWVRRMRGSRYLSEAESSSRGLPISAALRFQKHPEGPE